MIFPRSLLTATFRSATGAILCLTLTGLSSPLSAQTPTGTTILPRIGVFHGIQDVGHVGLDNGAPFEVGSLGPGLEVGVALQHAVGQPGWLVETSVMGSLFGAARGCYRGMELIALCRDLPVKSATASFSVISPPLATLPMFFEAGLGARHEIVSGNGEHQFLEGDAADWQMAMLVGVGIRRRIAGNVYEIELKDNASFPDFGGNRRMTNEIVLSVGLPIQIR